MEKGNEFQIYSEKNPDKIEFIDIKKEMEAFNEFVAITLRENAIRRQKSWESASKIILTC